MFKPQAGGNVWKLPAYVRAIFFPIEALANLMFLIRYALGDKQEFSKVEHKKVFVISTVESCLYMFIGGFCGIAFVRWQPTQTAVQVMLVGVVWILTVMVTVRLRRSEYFMFDMKLPRFQSPASASTGLLVVLTYQIVHSTIQSGIIRLAFVVVIIVTILYRFSKKTYASKKVGEAVAKGVVE